MFLSSNTVHSSFNKNKENTCEDTGAWCAFLEPYCEHNDVQGQCRKTCHKCNGKYKINIYIIQLITIAFNENYLILNGNILYFRINSLFHSFTQPK